MQTFLPSSDFRECARVLDTRRLGKQRVENLQILKALLDPSYGWQHHPAVKMWRGYEWALEDYHDAIVIQWCARGFADTTYDTFASLVPRSGEYVKPPWLGDERVHMTHRSNLLRKDPAHYGQFGWTETPDYLYFWPVK